MAYYTHLPQKYPSWGHFLQENVMLFIWQQYGPARRNHPFPLEGLTTTAPLKLLKTFK